MQIYLLRRQLGTQQLKKYDWIRELGLTFDNYEDAYACAMSRTHYRVEDCEWVVGGED